MANFLSPIFNEQTVTSAGAPAVGYKINTYQAGTSTAAATYTTSTGSTPQANPIVLNSRGAPTDVIWLAEGVSYKFVLTDADDVVIDTFDNISGVNDTSVAAGEWTSSGFTPTYIGATSFSVVGDKTSSFLVGRRIRSTNTGGTTYSLITVSSYSSGTGLTTVTVTNDSGTLDAGLSVVDLAILTPTNPSLPNSAAVRTALGVVGSGAITTSGLTMATARILGRTTASTGAVEELTAAQVSAFASAASDTAQGAVELITAAEVQTGTDSTRATTVSALRSGWLVNATMQATTSGTEKDFTVPSWAKRIVVMFDGVSTNGTDPICIKLGDSGGIESSGYKGAVSYLVGAAGTENFTNEFRVVNDGGYGATNVVNGATTLTLMDASTNTWAASGTVGGSDNATVHVMGGVKPLSATLTTVRITTSGGTQAFDAGNVNIMYE